MNLNQFNNPLPARFNFNRMNMLNRRGINPFSSPYMSGTSNVYENPYFSNIGFGGLYSNMINQDQQDFLRDRFQKQEELMRGELPDPAPDSAEELAQIEGDHYNLARRRATNMALNRQQVKHWDRGGMSPNPFAPYWMGNIHGPYSGYHLTADSVPTI